MFLSKDEFEEVYEADYRSMTEDSARFMSLRDSAVYKVKEEKTRRRGLAFVDGLIKTSAG